MNKHATAADSEMVELGNALRQAAALVRQEGVRAVLGPSCSNELATVIAGFRQRFPLHFAGINPTEET